MTKISLFCSSCKALNNVDGENLSSFKCIYCGTDNLVDNDKVVINQQVNDNLPTEVEFNIKLKNAKYTLNKLKLYEDAYRMYKELYLIDDKNVDVLEGLMLTLTHNFNYKSVKNFGLDEDIEFNEYLSKYEDVQKRISKVTNYIKKYNNFLPLAKERSTLDDIDNNVDWFKHIFLSILSILILFILFLILVTRRWI